MDMCVSDKFHDSCPTLGDIIMDTVSVLGIGRQAGDNSTSV